MSNLSTPRHKVATVKSLTAQFFSKDHKPTARDLEDALDEVLTRSANRGRPMSIHWDGRAYVPFQRMTKLPKIGKGNEGRA